MCVCVVQGLDGAQRGEQAFADGLQLVVIEREQIEALQVFESVHPQAVDLVGVKQPGWTKKGVLSFSQSHGELEHTKYTITHIRVHVSLIKFTIQPLD